ncbi:HNH endonuclease [Speluncibacter jeojiensis]|uniref:HNH endonuclease n=1 Tax=Speluncibacter jeojiensis TaxID=2710754 RepID=A0A9X4M696_9ACTN|nr:HNH endonuclease [Corynebacteriales bacterium D3-21]
MTSWIVKIGKNTPEHWGFARDDQFWDVREPGSFKKIRPGEDVFFWLSGTGFQSWVRTTSSLYPIGIHARTAHWVDRDTGGYTHRFEFEVISDDVTDPATWSKLQDAAGRNYAPPAPANPVDEPSAEAFLRTRFGRGSDRTFESAGLPISYRYGDDLRERAKSEIVLRKGQSKFRDSLLAAYGSTCAVTGSTVTAVLEAAHIDRYYGEHTNHVTNGLLLRSDIHTLFDLRQFTIADDMTILLAPWLRDSEYAYLHGCTIRMPSDTHLRLNREALARHRESCDWA